MTKPTHEAPTFRFFIDGVEYKWEDLTKDGKIWLLKKLFP